MGSLFFFSNLLGLSLHILVHGRAGVRSHSKGETQQGANNGFNRVTVSCLFFASVHMAYVNHPEMSNGSFEFFAGSGQER